MFFLFVCICIAYLFFPFKEESLPLRRIAPILLLIISITLIMYNSNLPHSSLLMINSIAVSCDHILFCDPFPLL